METEEIVSKLASVFIGMFAFFVFGLGVLLFVNAFAELARGALDGFVVYGYFASMSLVGGFLLGFLSLLFWED